MFTASNEDTDEKCSTTELEIDARNGVLAEGAATRLYLSAGTASG